MDAYLLRHFHALTAAYLNGMRAVGEGRMHPHFLASSAPIYDELMHVKAPLEVQNDVIRCAVLWAPKVITNGGVQRVMVVQMPHQNLNKVQSRIVVGPLGRLEQDKPLLKRLMESVLKVKKVRQHTGYWFSGKELYIGKYRFTLDRFEKMGMQFYAHLDMEVQNGIAGLEAHIKKSQVTKDTP